MIPTHESGARLARTIESVLAQDPGRDRMQISVIDDASTVHDPQRIVDRVAGSRVSVWRHAHPVGAPTNFTTCVQRAVGHWVHILHDDDIVLPGFYASYQRLIEQVEQTAGGCVMVAGRSYHVDDEEVIEATSPEVATQGGVLLDPVRTIALRHPFTFVSVVVARSSYESSGGFDPALVHAADWEMWTRIAMLGPVAVVEEPCSMYRRHADSDTQRLERSTAYHSDTLSAIDIIAERLEDPRTSRAFRRDARRQLSARALQVAVKACSSRQWRNAWANAGRAVRSPPSRHTLRAAWHLVRDR